MNIIAKLREAAAYFGDALCERAADEIESLTENANQHMADVERLTAENEERLRRNREQSETIERQAARIAELERVGMPVVLESIRTQSALIERLTRELNASEVGHGAALSEVARLSRELECWRVNWESWKQSVPGQAEAERDRLAAELAEFTSAIVKEALEVKRLRAALRDLKGWCKPDEFSPPGHWAAHRRAEEALPGGEE